MSKELTEFLKSSVAVTQSMIDLQTRHYQQYREALEKEQYANTAPIHGLSYTGISSCEAKGLSNCPNTYKVKVDGEWVTEEEDC